MGGGARSDEQGMASWVLEGEGLRKDLLSVLLSLVA